MNKLSNILLLLITGLWACTGTNGDVDASGNFEAEEVIVSAEAAGKLLAFDVEEGAALEAKKVVGLIDTTQLYLRKKQLQYSIRAVIARKPNVPVQLAALREQIETTTREKKRIESLLKDDAATKKQLDDITSQLDVLQRQYDATQSSLTVSTQSIQSETLPLQAQLDQVQDQLEKSKIVNPLSGTVLTKYVEKDEVTAPGKALYKIANLETMTLRAYLTGNQLPQVKLGQSVEVLVDDGKGLKSYPGTIAWISDKAEFTPKTIQTKEERANLVYAVKITVKNDGYLKLGMYGDVKLNEQLTKSN
ncbi:MAG: HlyD family efflux transporter periplasmic adaptor subunit [Cyclobacteriaceae bacterium]|nr:HlyD family efflux transporter periplasmic adaptor subunit [Cyclobacteriaceae bacterium]